MDLETKAQQKKRGFYPQFKDQRRSLIQSPSGLNLKLKNVHSIPVRIQLQCESEITEMKNINCINLFNPKKNNII